MLVSLSIDKVCSYGVLDQVVATGGETARNVRVVESSVPSNNTVPNYHTITALYCGSRRYAPSLMRCIAIDGAEGNSNLTSTTEDATSIRSSRIARDSAVSERELAVIEDATTTVRTSGGGAVTRDSTVNDGERTVIEDATCAERVSSVSRCLVVGDSAIGERERTCVEDATSTDAIHAATGNTIVRDGSISEEERT